MPIRSQSKVTTLPTGLELARGGISNATLGGTSGWNAAVGTTTETIHPLGGLVTRPDSAGELLKVSSSNALDKNAGSGACRRVRINGFAADGTALEEDLNMDGTDGTTQVTTTNSFAYVTNFQVQKTGSGGDFNAGDITLYLNDGTTAISVIKAGENDELQAAWTMNGDQTGFITSFTASTDEPAYISIWGGASGKSWLQKFRMLLPAAGTYTYNLPNPIQLGAEGLFTYMEFRGQAVSTTANMTVDFQIIVEE